MAAERPWRPLVCTLTRQRFSTTGERASERSAGGGVEEDEHTYPEDNTKIRTPSAPFEMRSGEVGEVGNSDTAQAHHHHPPLPMLQKLLNSNFGGENTQIETGLLRSAYRRVLVETMNALVRSGLKEEVVGSAGRVRLIDLMSLLGGVCREAIKLEEANNGVRNLFADLLGEEGGERMMKEVVMKLAEILRVDGRHQKELNGDLGGVAEEGAGGLGGGKKRRFVTKSRSSYVARSAWEKIGVRDKPIEGRRSYDVELSVGAAAALKGIGLVLNLVLRGTGNNKEVEKTLEFMKNSRRMVGGLVSMFLNKGYETKGGMAGAAIVWRVAGEAIVAVAGRTVKEGEGGKERNSCLHQYEGEMLAHVTSGDKCNDERKEIFYFNKIDRIL